MFRIYKFILLVSLLSFSKSFHVEIDIIDNDPTMSLKIICRSPSEKLDLGKKDIVLWHGTQLDKDDQQKLSRRLGMDLLIYNMSIKASTKHQCYLVAPESLLVKLERTKLGMRMARDDGTASVSMENGICPPGHRIAEDRCFPCFPGSYTSGQQTECFLCPKNFYMDKQAADACWPCPEGTNTLSQGSDSQESCVYLDEKGHVQIKQSPLWIPIYVLIGVIILCLWILIIYLLIRYRKLQIKKPSTKKRPSADDHVYERINDTDEEEPIYAEIGDYGGEYEEPKKASESHTYLDLEAPTLPPRRKDSRIGSLYKTLSEDQYEIPISRSGQMKSRSEEPYERISDDGYEIPIRRQFSNSVVEFRDDSADRMSSDINSEDVINSDERGNENKMISSRSVPYVPEQFSTENVRQKPSGLFSDSRVNEGRKYSSENRK